MKQTLFIILVGFFNLTYGQTFPDLEGALTREFPEKSNKDGRWVFYEDQANIEEIKKPLVKLRKSNCDFYKVTLTNYLGYHVNQGTCLILFDSTNSKTILVQPLWYSGISEVLIKLFVKEQFDNQKNLLSFLEELHELMELGSGYKFVNTGYSDNLITYDLVYFKGDAYTTSGNGISSTVNYNKDGVWRNIEIEIKDLKIKRYISINPALKDRKGFDDRTIIK